MSKKISILILLVITLLCTSTVFGVNFTDMDSHWAKNVVNEMANKGILNGFEDGTFRPNENVTREQFVKILVETFDLKSDNVSEYKDIEPDRWSKKYIDIAGNYLVHSKSFYPEDECRRADVAEAIAQVMELGKLVDEPNYELLKGFSDYDYIMEKLQGIESESVALVVEFGIMQGKGGYFDAKGYLTRAEVSQLLYNLSENKNTGDLDNDGKITSKDSYMVYDYLNGRLKESEIEVIRADVNKDGVVNELDAEIICECAHENGNIKILPHKCKYINKDSAYEIIDDSYHKIKSICECGIEYVTLESKKIHKFENGICICGAKENDDILYGDVDGDGKVNSTDLEIVTAYAKGNNLPKPITNLVAADVNKDGNIYEYDAWLIERKIVDKIKLPHINCSSYTRNYENITSTNHEYMDVCECGKIKTSYKTEKHTVSGKGDQTPYYYPFTHTHREYCSCGYNLVYVKEEHTFENGKCIVCNFDLGYVDRNEDDKATEHDSWLMWNIPDTWGHYRM